MRVLRLVSGTALVTTLAALTPGAALAGVPVTGLIKIDESVEGQTPTVSSDNSAITLNPVTSAGFSEGWTITFTVPGIQPAGGFNLGGGEGGLYEPGTNQTQLSDVLTFNTPTLGANATTFSFTLASDSETLHFDPFFCDATNVICVLEDGTFQTLMEIRTTAFDSILIQVKSDLDPVPEPGPLSLLAGGLGALAFMRRRRKILA